MEDYYRFIPDFPHGDGVHPCDFGQAKEAGYLVEILDNIYNNLPPDISIPAVPQVPTPLTESTYEFATYKDRTDITPSTETIGNWDNGTNVHALGSGWKSSTVGNELVFDISGYTSIGIQFWRGPDTSFGKAEVWLDDGEHIVLDGWYSFGWGECKLVASGLSRNDQHKLHVKIIQETSGTGHTFEVMSIMLAGSQ